MAPSVEPGVLAHPDDRARLAERQMRWRPRAIERRAHLSGAVVRLVRRFRVAAGGGLLPSVPHGPADPPTVAPAAVPGTATLASFAPLGRDLRG